MINYIIFSHWMKHKINNTGWVMKWWWNRGVEQMQTPVLRECWTFLIYIFLHQKRKQCLEFALPKPGEICKHLASTYSSNSHARGLHYLTFVCGNKAGKINAMGRVVLRKNVSESSVLSILFEWWEVPLQIEFANICCQKTTTSLRNFDRKGELEKKEICDH